MFEVYLQYAYIAGIKHKISSFDNIILYMRYTAYLANL
jgi:hypothetical protein